MYVCAESIDSGVLANQARGGGAIPTSALSLHIEEVAVQVAQWLNAKWHSVLPDTDLGNIVRNKRCVCYVAVFNDLPYATAIWTTPVAANRLTDGFDLLELRRFAIHRNAPRNTASRVLAVMCQLLHTKWPEVRRWISYQAIDHHHGTIYKAAGWNVRAYSESEVWHVGEERADMQTTSAKVRWEKVAPKVKHISSPLITRPILLGND